MKGLGLSARTMSILFMSVIIFSSIVFGSYVVLSTKLTAIEGYQKLTPIQNSPLCGSGSAHEVPIWSSSMSIDSKPSRPERKVEEQSYSELTGISVPAQRSAKPSKPNKYSFLENEVAVSDVPKPPPQTTAEVSVEPEIKKRRPKVTSTGLVKLQKGAHDGLGFGTGALN